MRGKGFSSKVWSIVIILAIAIFVIIGLLFIVNNQDKPNGSVLGPKTVVANHEKYIDKNITVSGYFYNMYSDDNYGYISSKQIDEPLKQGEFEEHELLLINFSSINDISESFHKYYFYGTLKETDTSLFPSDLVYLDVNKIETV